MTTATTPVATIKDGALILDKGSFVEAVKAALPVEPAPVAHQEAAGGWLPSGGDVRDAAFGGFAAIALSKAIGHSIAPLASPALSDYAAWLVISKWGGRFIRGGAKDAAQIVLLVDALRALLPVVDQQVNNIVDKLPVLVKGNAIQVPSLGSGGPSAAMRQGDLFSGRQGGGSLVVNRLAVTNI